MSTIVVEKLDETYIRVFSDDDVEMGMSEYFTYEFPGAKYTPKYRAGIWDGKLRLYNLQRKTLYTGLLDRVYKYAEANGHNVVLDNAWETGTDISIEEVTKFTNSLDLHLPEGEKIRDYQIRAIHFALTNWRNLTICPTGSGKSLIIYCLLRWHLQHDRKHIVIVPTTNLVEQMYSDFNDYSKNNGWPAEAHCQKLYSGFPKHFDKDILFTTWQSITDMSKEWYEQFDVVVGDEAHLHKAKSLVAILEKMVNTTYRIGTTGSLDDQKIHHLVLEGLFGAINQVITTKELQKLGFLSPLNIKSLILKYPKQICKENSKLKYHEELEFLVTHDKRNRIIRKLALMQTGNTLVLFQLVEKQGRDLFELIKAKAGDRPVYFICKDTDAEAREEIRKILAVETNAIVVASFGTSSTGINIPSISCIIFASPTKSLIRVIQSIGRGLRINKDKFECVLYDLTDDMSWRTHKNFALKHGAERYKIYAKEGHPVKLIEITI